MRTTREHGDEQQKVPVQAVLRLDGAQRRHGRLGADHMGERGDDLADDLRVGPERLEDVAPPVLDARLAFGEDLPHQAVERLDHRAVGGVAVVLVGLAAREIAFLPSERPQDLVHERGLADAGVAGDEDALAESRERALERGGQGLDVVLAAVELLRDPEQVPAIALTRGEGLDSPRAAQGLRGSARRRRAGPRHSGSGPPRSSRAASARCLR